MKRRTAIQAGLLAGAITATSAAQETDLEPVALGDDRGSSKPVFIATWEFGKAACERSREVLQTGSILDAIELGIHITELDESISSVGYGGYPNAAGVVQLDASFMDGRRQQAGAVAALEGFPNPISVARRVMESTPHVMLAGTDAAKFAKANGFAERQMLTRPARRAWQDWQETQKNSTVKPIDTHDTIALLGVDSAGHIAGGCSTSGLAFKLPGRVGDSPIIGSGLYVDGKIGAAGATGVGENILRYCGSFLIVEFMRQGLSPTDACEAAIRRIVAGEQRKPSELSVNFVALNKAGQVGAAGTDSDFRFAVVDSQRSRVIRPRLVG